MLTGDISNNYADDIVIFVGCIGDTQARASLKIDVKNEVHGLQSTE